MKKPKIGILSGMGAAAGARFYNLLIQECQKQGAQDDKDFPEVIIINMSSNGMDKTGICDENTVKKDIIHALNQFEKCGVDSVIMACNSVHEYFDFLQKNTSVHIMNMVESAQVATKASKVGIISSRSTRKSKLYSGVYINDSQQHEVDNIIGRIISGYTNNQRLAEDKMFLFRTIDGLISEGCQSVILGCTELPLICERRMSVVDPAEIIIKEVLSL